MSDSLYRGCSIPARLPFIEAAAKYIIDQLKLDIQDMGEMPCCMEPVGLKSLDHDSWSDVSSFICSRSKGRLITLCDGCTVSLAGSVKEKGSDLDVIGFLEVIYENLSSIKSKVTSPIGISLAVFPGCHCESLMSSKGRDANKMMSEIVEAIGGKALTPSENLCCGGGVSSIDDNLAKAILNESVESFKATGASAVVTSCPFCFMQFDMVARYRTYSIVELTAKAMGWDADTEQFHRGK
jgi:heterodisulfide reductase subunit B